MHRRGLLFAAVLLLAVAPLASAHAVMLSSDPASGARLDQAPARVRVTLTEPVDPSGTGLKVVDASNRQVDLGDGKVQNGANPVLTVSLPPDLPDGAYRILWHAVAQDTHPTAGTVGFSVGAFEPPGSVRPSVNAIHWESALGRSLMYLGLALGLGAGCFLVWMPTAGVRLARPPLVQALAVGSAAHFAGAAWLLQDYETSVGQSFAQVVHGRPGAVLATRVLLSACAAMLALVALIPRARNRTAVPVAVLLLAAAGLASPLLGHAIVHGIPGLVVDALHLVASALWAGSLLVFLWVVAGASGRGLTALEVRTLGIRFGTLALLCVIVLVVSGVTAGLIVAGVGSLTHPFAVLGTAWGAFLAAKVAIAGVMVALAGINRYGLLEPARTSGLAGWTQGRLARLGPAFRPLGAHDSAAGFRRTLAVEATLGAVVLVLAGFLTSISPPASAHAGPSGSVLDLSGAGDAYLYALAIQPTPQSGGHSDLHLYIQSRDTGQNLTSNTCGRDSCVQIDFGDPANPDLGVETHVLAPDGHGAWVVNVLWSRAGHIVATARVQSAEVFQDNATFEFHVE